MRITRASFTAVPVLVLWSWGGPAVPAGHPLSPLPQIDSPGRRVLQPASFDRDAVQVDVFVAGAGGYHTYRIPSVILTPGGSLVAFAEARRGGASDTGDIDLVSRRSDDGGQTWSPMVVIGDNGPNTFGNPCPVIDRTTGTIWLLTDAQPRRRSRTRHPRGHLARHAHGVGHEEHATTGGRGASPSRSRRARSVPAGRGTRPGPALACSCGAGGW